MANTILDDVLFQLLKEGGWVLTANQRLARSLVEDFETRSVLNGDTAWVAPRIMAFSQWYADQVHQTLHESELLLSELQLRHLWEDAVRTDSQASHGDLLQVPQTAQKALEASRLLSVYRCSLPSSGLTPDQEAFSRWLTAVNKVCREKGWVDPAHALTRVEERVRQGFWCPAGSVRILGFDDPPPEVTSIHRALIDVNIDASILPLPVRTSGVSYGATDPEEEIRAAACWARQLALSGQKRVGIVLINDRYQRDVERIFLQELQPGNCLLADPEDSSLSFSQGRPLIEEGVVSAALFFLGLGRKLSLEEIGRLLRTPYFGGGWGERHSRALLDAQLRRGHATQWSLPALIQSRRGSRCPRLKKYLSGWLEEKGEGHRTASEWVRCLDRELHHLGWPGDRGLSSRDYQAIQSFRGKALARMVSLDTFGKTYPRHEMLRQLRQICQEMLFQIEAPQGAVQVFGPLEAAGQTFDGLWVLGCSEELLPQAPRLNPFLPRTLQREADMPRSSAGRELRQAQHLVQRLAASSDRVVFSFSSLDQGGTRRPSPLIRELPELPMEQLPDSWSPVQAMVDQHVPLDVEDDLCGSPLPAEVEVSGGTGVIRDQALCPFRAFGHYRLNAKGLEQPDVGLDASLRGTLVHKGLEILWRELGCLDALVTLSPEERHASIEKAVLQAIRQILPEGGAFPEPLLALEKERLVLVLQGWLNLEEKRPPFSVMETELEHQVILGQLHLRMVIDRVDRTEDGDLLVIDYKTGRVDESSLHPDSLTEPQLPLYATAALEEEVDGILLGQVRSGEFRFRGVTRTAIVDKVPGLDSEKNRERWKAEGWQDLLSRWKEGTRALAGAFARGEASVAPIDPVKTCTWCDLGALCRVVESDSLTGETDEP